jgi:RNA polymerase sigma-70 factor (ECF subfamily)
MRKRRRRPATAAAGQSFDEVVLPHLPAAHRLARWLTQNEHDAEDVVQEASLRAFRYFRTFTGGNGRAWFLRIVRNTCHGWRGTGNPAPPESFDEERHSSIRPVSDPETLVLQGDDVMLIEQAMRNVPNRFRELLVLREVNGLSYRELADALDIPIGTVMSSLSRGRQAFRGALEHQMKSSGAMDAGLRVSPPPGARRAARAGSPGATAAARRQAWPPSPPAGCAASHGSP